MTSGRYRFELSMIPFVAIAVAALCRPGPMWSSALYTAALIWLCCAIVLAFVSIDRTFWTGFAVFGWVHLAFLLGMSPGSRSCPPPPTPFEQGLSALETTVRKPSPSGLVLGNF